MWNVTFQKLSQLRVNIYRKELFAEDEIFYFFKKMLYGLPHFAAYIFIFPTQGTYIFHKFLQQISAHKEIL